jgi:NMD protein affecting ribosome stability and mRNA decay
MAQYALDGKAKFNRKLPAYFHTSHPQLCRYLRHSSKWVQVSGELYRKEGCKALSEKNKARKEHKLIKNMGGHFRAVQGFKYLGER